MLSSVRPSIFGGETQKVDAGINQFAGSQTANRLVITVGKFSVADIFDNNKYAHDPRNDFLNWAIVDTGTFDYAAEPWGYTLGAAAEWYQGDWTLRGGVFDLSVLPNNLELDPTFQQFQWVGEIERRYELWGHPGKIAVTGFLSRGRMGTYEDAIALAQITGGPADIAAVPPISEPRRRQHESRTGDNVRFGCLRSRRLGERRYRALRIHRHRSHRPRPAYRSTASDGVGRTTPSALPVWSTAFRQIHEEFLNDGGLGILIGDGMLPHPGPEQIIESYYSYALSASTHLTADYQFIVNPGYNEDRGPVNVFSARMHWQF